MRLKYLKKTFHCKSLKNYISMYYLQKYDITPSNVSLKFWAISNLGDGLNSMNKNHCLTSF
jgi:hypothetical protein